jgi:tRNA threonylcarbamoyladenosine biosynthesis protein TsaB
MHFRHDLSPTLLAIETSSEMGSVCVVTRSEFFLETSPTNVKLSGWVIAAIDRVLLRAGVQRSNLDAVAFGAGPGAFTGVRTACATAQAISYALGLPLVSVNSLQALAALVNNDSPQGTQITVLIDARMNQLYSADYFRSNTGITICTSEAALVTVNEYAPKHLDAIFVGSGVSLWQKNAGTAYGVSTTVASAEKFNMYDLESRWAEGVARVACNLLLDDLSQQLVGSRDTNPLNAEPIYVRNDVAQTEAERALKRATT